MGRVWVFLFLYGITAILGMTLTFFWARFAYRRCGQIAHGCWHDRAFVLASAIACVAGGLTLVDGARVFGNAEYGLSKILMRPEGYVIGGGLIVRAIGLFKMAWLADLEANPPHWRWLRAMIGATVFWAIVAALMAPQVPFGR